MLDCSRTYDSSIWLHIRKFNDISIGLRVTWKDGNHKYFFLSFLEFMWKQFLWIEQEKFLIKIIFLNIKSISITKVKLLTINNLTQNYDYISSCYFVSLTKEVAFKLNKLEYPLPKHALCKIWLQLVLEKTYFFNFVNVLSLFGSYRSLWKGYDPSFEQTWFPITHGYFMPELIGSGWNDL